MNTSAKPRSLLISLLLVLVVAGLVFGAAYGSMLLFRGQSADQLIAQRWEKGEELNAGGGGLSQAPEKIPYEPKWNSTQEMIDAAPEIEMVEKKFTPSLSMEYTMLLPPDAGEAEEPDLAKITDTLGLKIFEGYIDPSDQWKDARRGEYRKIEKIVMDNDNVFVYECSDPDLGERRYDAAFNVRSGLVNYRMYLRPPSNREGLFTLEECQLAAKVAMTIDIHEPEFASPIDALKFYQATYQPQDAKDPQAVKQVWIPSMAPSPAVELLEQFPGLESLTVGVSFNDPKSLEVILKLPKLKALTFIENSETTKVFDTVRQAKQLETLDINRYGSLNDNQLEQLPQLANLKQLSFTYTKENQSTLAVLAKMPKLEALEINYYSDAKPVTTTNIAAIANLKRLQVTGMKPLTDELLAPLSGCSEVTSLHLNDDRMMLGSEEEYQSRLTDTTLEMIGSLKGLQQLQITLSDPNEDRKNTRFTSQGLDQLSDLPLTKLVLSQVNQGKPLADAIVGMTKLEHLVLKGSDIEMEDLERIASMETLQSLGVANNKKIESVYELKKKFPELKFPQLRYEPVKIIE